LRAAKAIAGYGVAVVVLGSLLAPWSFWAAHPYLPAVPFRRVFDRALLVVALIGLWPLLRTLGLRSWGEFGYVRSVSWWRHTLTGFALGIGSLAIAGMLLLAQGSRTLGSPNAGPVRLFGFLMAGVAVAIIEETFFRGGLQAALQRGVSVLVAIVTTSVFYSAMHFLKPKGAAIPVETVNWLSGFSYLRQVLMHSWQVPGVAVGFMTLFLAGCVLGLGFARTRALYLSIGIHAGWVFTLKTYAALTDASGPRTWWGGAALVDNMLVWPILVGVLGLVAWIYRDKPS
jgi:membrane protease YdiL (CAAX protease family)